MIKEWKDCQKDPPKQYHRIEIRDKNNKRYIGYRCGKHYYETYGNYVIQEPTYWREPPKGSALLSEILEKIRVNIGGELSYDSVRE